MPIEGPYLASCSTAVFSRLAKGLEPWPSSSSFLSRRKPEYIVNTEMGHPGEEFKYNYLKLKSLFHGPVSHSGKQAA